ncbi:MAG: iron-sulfur cluster assembly protein, partial [Pirellulaceae bacterium]|nr:iron-sulfur cluster assembly protein [Pirellulaceae bacterium]
MTITEEAVFEQLSQVVDPDLPGINIVELGLIYKIEFEEIPADEIAAAKTSEPAPDAGLTIQDDHGFTAPIALDAPRDAGAAQAPDAAADAAAQTPDAAEATEAAGPSDSGATETCGDDQAGAETTRVKIEMTLTSPM